MDPFARRRLGRTQVEVTQLGFGGAGLGDLFEVIPEAQAAATLQAAWDAGIRYYDTAPWYGLTQSEHRFGRFYTAENPSMESKLIPRLCGVILRNAARTSGEPAKCGWRRPRSPGFRSEPISAARPLGRLDRRK